MPSRAAKNLANNLVRYGKRTTGYIADGWNYFTDATPHEKRRASVFSKATQDLKQGVPGATARSRALQKIYKRK